MKRRLSRAWLLIAGFGLGLLVCVYIIFVWTYPIGVPLSDFSAFWFASEETTSTSADGVVLRHVLNDAGAAHSGLHYVWVLHRRSWWLPWRVVASGWSESRKADEAIRWLDRTTFEIQLGNRRRSATLITHRVRL